MKIKDRLNRFTTAFKVWKTLKKRNFKSWYLFRLNMFKLWLSSAPKEQYYLTKGAYYLRKGAIFQVGQPIKTSIPKSQKIKTRYIKNMYFNFNLNKVTANYTDKPIKGISEHFKK